MTDRDRRVGISDARVLRRKRLSRLRVVLFTVTVVVLLAWIGAGLFVAFAPASLTTVSSPAVRDAVVHPITPSSFRITWPGLVPLRSAGATSPLPPDFVVSASTTDPVHAYALPYPGAPDVAPATIRSLKPKHRYVAITVDDGIPFDKRLLDLFEQHNVRGTTFLLGQAVREYPKLVERLHDDGWEIANHTWDHPILTGVSDDGIRRELSRTQDAISAITGDQAPYMRPPGGGTSERVKRVAASMGYRVVLWNRTSADTSAKATPYQLFRNVIYGNKAAGQGPIQPGDVILCHWGRPCTYEAMRSILPELERQGFTVVTISELIADSGGPEALR